MPLNIVIEFNVKLYLQATIVQPMNDLTHTSTAVGSLA